MVLRGSREKEKQEVASKEREQEKVLWAQTEKDLYNQRKEACLLKERVSVLVHPLCVHHEQSVKRTTSGSFSS